MNNMTVAIILAAGSSLRMEGEDKVLTQVSGRPLIAHVVERFLKSKRIDEIVVVGSRKNVGTLRKEFSVKKFPKVHLTIGGKTRFQSSKIALRFAEKKFHLNDMSVVVIHNAANILVTKGEIEETIKIARKSGACIVARPATDTLKMVHPSKKGALDGTIDRSTIVHAETPQTFRHDVLKAAYRRAIEATDDAMLVERVGGEVSWIPASAFNRKITTPYDLRVAKAILENQTGETVYGLGTDTHLFEKGTKKPLMLCGMRIPQYTKLAADSDGDVALHALAAAISQAIGGGSLGTFATALCKSGVSDSKKYIAHILGEAAKKSITITHVGLNFECLRPKIDPLTPLMKKSLSAILSISEEHIGIIATTGDVTEGSGKDTGIRVTAIVTVQRGI